MNDATPPAAELQLFPPGTDLFTALGLPRLLNVDARSLEEPFHDLSRRFHPDRFATAEPRLRRISLENSALVNRAFRTLRDPWERAGYLVELEEGRGAAIEAHPPEGLFEEILELQEVLAELRASVASGGAEAALLEHANRAAAPFRAAHTALDSRLQTLFDEWDASAGAEGVTVAHAAILRKLKELLGERRYLRRVVADIEAASEGRAAPRDI
jgi:molecular chaperone HscB